jgi:thioredoxin-related protein
MNVRSLVEHEYIVSWLRIALFGVLLTGVFSLPVRADDPAEMQWYDLEEAQRRARSDGKKVLLFMEAEWCSYCKKMKREVFSRSDVQEVLRSNYYPVKVDIESAKEVTVNQKTMTERELGQSLEITATPTIIFLNDQGEILGRQPGFIESGIFTHLLHFVTSEKFDELSFREYLDQQEKG